MKFKYYAVMALFFATACSDKDSDGNSRFKVDETYSAVEWKGSAPTHFHEGAFKVSGTIDLDANNKISAGTFTIPIASISNFDLTEPDKTTLLNHLKSSDFLNLALHPEAKFKITKVEDYAQEGTSMNAKITGDFTLIGQTHSISFPARVLVTQNKLSAEGTLTFNRLQWGMNSFNDPNDPQALYILPDIKITLKIFSNRSSS